MVVRYFYRHDTRGLSFGRLEQLSFLLSIAISATLPMTGESNYISLTDLFMVKMTLTNTNEDLAVALQTSLRSHHIYTTISLRLLNRLVTNCRQDPISRDQIILSYNQIFLDLYISFQFFYYKIKYLSKPIRVTRISA